MVVFPPAASIVLIPPSYSLVVAAAGSIHKAIGLENVAVFKTFFTAVDWCETQLIRSLDAYEEDGNASFWATSHFSRRESFKYVLLVVVAGVMPLLPLRKLYARGGGCCSCDTTSPVERLVYARVSCLWSCSCDACFATAPSLFWTCPNVVPEVTVRMFARNRLW